MSSPENKTAIITGANRGIGAAIALRLAAQGARVVISYQSDTASAEAVAASILAQGGHAILAQGDVSKTADFTRIFDEAEAAFGGVDILVNNAGLMKNMPTADMDEALFDRMFAVNVRGVLNGCKLAANRLRDMGRIVNISTSVIGSSPPGYGAYCATKAAVEALTRSLSKEIGSRGIRVNAVAPGPVDTELLTQANSPERLRMFADMTPLGRLGHVQDIAEVVAFLVTDAAGWIHGQTIRVNGGIVA